MDGTSTKTKAAGDVVDLASGASSAEDSTGGTPEFDEVAWVK